MKKKQEQRTKTCADCIHEIACRMWTDGRPISDSSASLCPNYTTVKDSGAYLCGVLDERKRKQTNADRIRAMSDEELTEFLESTHTNMAIKLGGEYIVRAKEYIEIWLKQPAEVEG